MLKRLPPMATLAATLAVAGALAGGTAMAKEWTCYGYMPSALHPTIVGLTAIGEQLEAATGGEIDVTCHAGGSLGIAAADVTAAVSDGIVQYASNAFITGAVPIVGIFALPGLFSTEEELMRGLEAAEPFIEAAMAAQDLVYLGSYHYPRQVIFSTQPVAALADLKGRKIRVSSGEQAEFVVRFGGTPVTLASADVAQALQLGTISGVMTAASGGGRLWADILTHNYELGPNFTVSPVFANADAFNELTPDQQAKLREIVKAEVVNISNGMATENTDLVKDFAAKGMVINPPLAEDEALMVVTVEDYWPVWAKDRGAEAEAALAAVRAAIGK